MSEKSFEPTPDKLRKALKEGKSKRSQLLGASVLFVSVVYGISQALRKYWVRIHLLVECLWSQEFTGAEECGRVMLAGVGQSLICFLIGMLVLAVAVQWFQVGNVWVSAVLLPDFKRVSPGSGSSRIAAGINDLLPLVLKIMVVLAGMAVLLASLASSLKHYGHVFLFQQSALVLEDLHWFLQSLAGLFLCFGLYDMQQKRRKYRDQVFMNHQEMRREQRESEGDALMRSQRRALHQALSRQDLIRQIKKARVILVERATPAPAGGS